MAVHLSDLVSRHGGSIRGDDPLLEGVAPLERAGPRDLAFCTSAKYRGLLADTRAGAVLISGEDLSMVRGTAWISGNPQLAFARAAAELHPPSPSETGVHPTAVVALSARIAADASIGPHCVVDEDAEIGSGVVLGPQCHVGQGVRVGAGSRLVARVSILRHCVIGRDCVLFPGVVIGADGFGYARAGSQWIKVPQLGRVVIGDRVEVGANTTVDRGALDDTVIEDGVKLDNQIQVGHNVRIGEDTAIAAGTGISGSAVIGRRCMIGGQVGIAGHITIVDDTTIMARATVPGGIERPGTYASAVFQTVPAGEWRRSAVRVKDLDSLARRVSALEGAIADDENTRTT